ncbi:BadF/BadG/BcrA/BcrD ATPase family protein [Burkholderia sp. L27(2015)]|uniref:BadF/BadG/BcrA/BcrD ATPase family protein n=1 Tax=Burkholderia sp. L27(2015) TaxID=1641858 RepID=UPI00131CC45D|nr:BadF/BadG/BcrA/BcrD ATPase family protein [Burkholderia sp. L27(2015)]
MSLTSTRYAFASHFATQSEIQHSARYLIGVDGGGTGCRVVLADRHGAILARAQGAAATLALGPVRAWAAIEAACNLAFRQAGLVMPGSVTSESAVSDLAIDARSDFAVDSATVSKTHSATQSATEASTLEASTLSSPDSFDASACVMACGLAGVNHPQWRAEFIERAPALAALTIDSDAYTTVLGAHGGAPGVVVALGTGSIGAVLERDGTYRTVGGYGFPASDEGSGAWLGLRAMQYAQYALDGRAARDAFAQALFKSTGIDGHESLIEWLAAARQADYARLAPVVLDYRDHAFVVQCLLKAGEEIGLMIAALDPHDAMPLVLAGGLAPALQDWVPGQYKSRLRAPQGDSASGALLLAHRYVQSR